LPVNVWSSSRTAAAGPIEGTVSGCAGSSNYSVIFGDCNSKCASGTATKDQMTACIGELNCLISGGPFEGPPYDSGHCGTDSMP
jgi:hypothetical protein